MPSAKIQGIVWDDRDLDRMPDAGEARLAGVTVELWRKHLLIRVATTLPDGSYRFSRLLPGTYRIVEHDPEGYTSRTPNEVWVTLLERQTVTVNFADVPEDIVHFIHVPIIAR